MDLDFTAEQDMLREMVRSVCAASSSLETVRALEDDPVGLLDRALEAARRARPARAHAARGVRRLGDDRARGRGGLRGVRARAGGVAALRQLGDERGPAAAGRVGRAARRAGRRASRPATRSSRPRGSSPTAGSGRAAIRTTATADGDGFRLDGTKWHVPFASAATRIVVLARTGDADGRGRPLPRRPATRRASSSQQQFTLASETQYAVTLSGVRVPRPTASAARARAGRRGTRPCSRASCSSPRRRSAGRAPRSSSPRSTRRTASSSTSRSARSRPSPTTSPTRRRTSRAARSSCTRRRRRSRQGQSVEQLAPMAKLFAVRDLPGRHRDGAAGVRRRRLHPRVRHPALLPAGQAAADLVVGRPRRSRSGSPPASLDG